jgi:uncharacterized membrane protein YdbT with pleckstrin-like domain
MSRPAALGGDDGAAPTGGPDLDPGADGRPARPALSRVSPRTLIVGPLRELARTVAVAAGAFAVAGPSTGLLIAAGVAVLSTVFHVVNWLTFTYRVDGDRIELRRELIARSVKTIPLERVRGVDITASFAHRLLGLAVVRIDAAAGGEGTEEGKLDAVAAEEAERLRTVLLRRRDASEVNAGSGVDAGSGIGAGTRVGAGDSGEGGGEGERAGSSPGFGADGAAKRVVGRSGVEVGAAGPADAGAEPPGHIGRVTPAGDGGYAGAGRQGDGAYEIYAQARRGWYLYGPLSGAFLLTPFAVAGSLIGFLYNLGDDLGLVTERRLTSAADWLAHSPVLLLVSLATLVVLTPVVAVLAFAIFNWDFTLRRRGGSIEIERGLFTRRSVSLERRRIRGVELRDNPFERRARVARLHALVTGLGDAATRGQLLPTSPWTVAAAAAGRVIAGPAAVPASTSGEAAAGPGEAAAGQGDGTTGAAGDSVSIPLTRHPRAALQRRLARAVVPWLLGAGLAAFLDQRPAMYALLVLAVAGVPLGLDRYRQLGHGADGARLTVRSGSLMRRRVVVERNAVVGWQIKQSLFQRRVGLATLIVAVGAGDEGYPSIDMAEPDTAGFARRITPAWVTPFLREDPGPGSPVRGDSGPDRDPEPRRPGSA